MTSKSGIGSNSGMSEFYRPSDALDASLAVDLPADLGRGGSGVRVRDRHAALVRDLLQTLERPGHVSDRLRQDRLLEIGRAACRGGGGILVGAGPACSGRDTT